MVKRFNALVLVSFSACLIAEPGGSRYRTLEPRAAAFQALFESGKFVVTRDALKQMGIEGEEARKILVSLDNLGARNRFDEKAKQEAREISEKIGVPFFNAIEEGKLAISKDNSLVSAKRDDQNDQRRARELLEVARAFQNHDRDLSQMKNDLQRIASQLGSKEAKPLSDKIAGFLKANENDAALLVLTRDFIERLEHASRGAYDRDGARSEPITAKEKLSLLNSLRILMELGANKNDIAKLPGLMELDKDMRSRVIEGFETVLERSESIARKDLNEPNGSLSEKMSKLSAEEYQKFSDEHLEKLTKDLTEVFEKKRGKFGEKEKEALKTFLCKCGPRLAQSAKGCPLAGTASNTRGGRNDTLVRDPKATHSTGGAM